MGDELESKCGSWSGVRPNARRNHETGCDHRSVQLHRCGGGSGTASAGLAGAFPDESRDIVLTKEELLGLEQELLVSKQAPLGTAHVDEWLMANGSTMGRTYVNDLRRHFGHGSTHAMLS